MRCLGLVVVRGVAPTAGEAGMRGAGNGPRAQRGAWSWGSVFCGGRRAQSRACGVFLGVFLASAANCLSHAVCASHPGLSSLGGCARLEGASMQSQGGRRGVRGLSLPPQRTVWTYIVI